MPSKKRGSQAAVPHASLFREDSGIAVSPEREHSSGLDDLTQGMSQLRVIGERTANWTLDIASAVAKEDENTAKSDNKPQGGGEETASRSTSSSVANSARSAVYTVSSSSGSRSAVARSAEEAEESVGTRTKIKAEPYVMTASLASEICSTILSSDDGDDSTDTLHGVSMSSQARKLLVYRAILVSLELCYDGAAGSASESRLRPRPAHFPACRLPLPDSIKQCVDLIKRYVFVCIPDFMAFQRGSLPPVDFTVFPSTLQLSRYIRKNHRYVKLSRAKQDLLNPLLRQIVHY